MAKHPQPWARQLDKYKKMNSGGTAPPKRPKVSPKANKDKKKAGCTGCAAKGLKRLILGGAALLKSELGVDAADQELQDKRKNICLGCESYDFGVCEDCGCFTAAKVKLKTEKCPKEKW